MNNSFPLGTLYVVTAPSGAGKTTLVKELITLLPHLKISISHTTRPTRPQEVDKENYIFVSEEDFAALDKAGVFMEKAKVFGYHYGTAYEWVKEQLKGGTDVILEIDWQGAQQIRKISDFNVVSIFIIPPSKHSLEERLRRRNQDNEEVIQYRLAEASEEISHYNEFDYMVVNKDFKRALEDLVCIIRAQRLKVATQEVMVRDVLKHII